ncbi:N-formylglutamate amidohydrolase [Oligoflexus tunisiensis]|uniref:N-formylglutamate amidohydrolase n=1 Tax=Oligoflexus tunisiensis TaxID=708132 RepID=UPI000AECACA6|nr:N-formylglutamate amidohydrolase [Oligoflexus tunisiensis]
MSFPIYHLRSTEAALKPIIVSVPHAGTEVPDEVAQTLRPDILKQLPDTDWFVPELYAFCTSLGIPMIHARLSRYVVDLNRPMEGPALYTDQRRQTDAMPLTTFDGVELYEADRRPDAAERERRARLYYQPYHAAVQQLLLNTQKKFKHVLLFDAHSIRRSVPSLAKDPFADMIVGDREGASADHRLSETLLRVLKNSPYQITYNQPFKGGQITRAFGNPANRVHALQLEMSQDVYMNEARSRLDAVKSAKVQNLLQTALLELSAVLETMP